MALGKRSKKTELGKQQQMQPAEQQQTQPDDPTQRLQAGIKAYLSSPLEVRHLAAKAAMENYPNLPGKFLQQDPLKQ
jgi:hypothetical protein